MENREFVTPVFQKQLCQGMRVGIQPLIGYTNAVEIFCRITTLFQATGPQFLFPWFRWYRKRTGTYSTLGKRRKRYSVPGASFVLSVSGLKAT